MDEIWKRTDIVSNIRADKGYYEISNLGNVRYEYLGKYYSKSITRKQKISKRQINRNSFRAYINKIETQFYVDELVGKYFLGVSSGPIYHIDGDYSNDCVDNLSGYSQYVQPGDVDELWVPVQGYEEFYHISNLGRIRSLERYKKNRIYPSMILEPICNSGYKYVTLYDSNRTGKSFAVHRLVCYHFNPTPDNYKELDVNHKDFDTTNNRASNLEWCTRLENVQYSSTRGRLNNHKHPEAKICGMLKGIPVYCIDTDTLYLRWTDAENDLGLWNGAIKNCLTKGVKSHGFSFREVDKHSEEYKKAFIDEFHRCYPEHELSDYRKHFEAADMLYLLE